VKTLFIIIHFRKPAFKIKTLSHDLCNDAVEFDVNTMVEIVCSGNGMIRNPRQKQSVCSVYKYLQTFSDKDSALMKALPAMLTDNF
jgi:hypothetical protein